MPRTLDETNLAKPGEIVQGSIDEEVTTSYTVVNRLGQGACGAVFTVKRENDGTEFAMKCEPITDKKTMFPMECKVMANARRAGSAHFLLVQDKGTVPDRYQFLIMQLVGKNLWDHRVAIPNHKFSMNTSLRAAEQCLAGLRDLHEIHFLHRDIKPHNFATGRPEDQKSQIIFILDFGLCRKYRTHDETLIPPREKAPFRGTTRYASYDALLNKDQSRKDDVESWVYMVLEWTIGALPWQMLPNRSKIAEAKKDLVAKEGAWNMVVDIKQLRPLKRILKFLIESTFESIPDYAGIYNILRKIAKSMKIPDDECLDWAEKGKKYDGATFIRKKDSAGSSTAKSVPSLSRPAQKHNV